LSGLCSSFYGECGRSTDATRLRVRCGEVQRQSRAVALVVSATVPDVEVVWLQLYWT